MIYVIYLFWMMIMMNDLSNFELWFALFIYLFWMMIEIDNDGWSVKRGRWQVRQFQFILSIHLIEKKIKNRVIVGTFCCLFIRWFKWLGLDAIWFCCWMEFLMTYNWCQLVFLGDWLYYYVLCYLYIFILNDDSDQWWKVR